jgi:hypothetical protein
MKRPPKCKVVQKSTWTTEQDIYLIENSLQSIDELLKHGRVKLEVRHKPPN